MKVLIFGAHGQLGRALQATFPASAQIRALARADCDITSDVEIHRSVGSWKPDLVINAAAYTAVDRAETDTRLAQAVNAIAPGRIAQAAAQSGARCIHISTDFVFGGDASTPRMPVDPVKPLGVYGATKLEGERTVLAVMPTALIVRTAWVYADRGGNFVNTMLHHMRERAVVRVVADQVGTPTWAPSLASAIWRLDERNAQGVHHYTDAGVASWYDFAVAIEEEARALGILQSTTAVIPISTADYPTPARRPAYSVLDKSNTWAILGKPAPHWRCNLRLNLERLKHV